MFEEQEGFRVENIEPSRDQIVGSSKPGSGFLIAG